MGARGGWSWSDNPDIQVDSFMANPGYQPSLMENFALGVAKAHRQINYSHYEYRNYKRSRLGDTGKVG